MTQIVLSTHPRSYPICRASSFPFQRLGESNSRSARGSLPVPTPFSCAAYAQVLSST